MSELHPNLKFYELPLFHDAYITNNDQIDKIDNLFPIHKIFLASKSDIFNTLFDNHGDKPLMLNPTDKIPIYYIGKNLDLKSLDYFLRYFYLNNKNCLEDYYKELINNIKILENLCDLFERYSIKNYKNFISKSFEHIFNNDQSTINNLIDLCVLYGLDITLYTLISMYLKNKNENYYLDLSKYQDTLMHVIYNYCDQISRGKNTYKFQICNYLNSHKSITPKFKFDLLAKLKIHIYSIDKCHLLSCNIYYDGYMALCYLLYSHYNDDRGGNRITKCYYPLISKCGLIGKVKDILHIDSNNPKIIIYSISGFLSESTYINKTNHVVFVNVDISEDEDGDEHREENLITNIYPLKIISRSNIIDNSFEIITEYTDYYEGNKLTDEDRIKLVDVNIYRCFI